MAVVPGRLARDEVLIDWWHPAAQRQIVNIGMIVTEKHKARIPRPRLKRLIHPFVLFWMRRHQDAELFV